VAERFNRTLLEKIQYLLSNSGHNKSVSAEVMTYASYLINRLSLSAIGGKALMEMWSGKPATDYDILRVFERPTYYHVSDEKLKPRVRKTVFL